MEQTVKAILARFDGDHDEAIRYCNGIAESASNESLKKEYHSLMFEIARRYVLRQEANA